MIKYNSPQNEINRNVLYELGDDNYKSTFDCTVYYRVTGLAILRNTISYIRKVKEVIKITVFKENLQAFVTALYDVCNDQKVSVNVPLLVVLNVHLSFIQIV